MKKGIVLLISVGLGVMFMLFVIANTWIGYEVQSECENAQRQYDGDCVEALLSTIDDDHNSFETRNSAIWAVGQLGDERALEILNKYYTGNIPDREPLDQTMSQYELKKAINLSKGGTNLTKLILFSI